MTHKCVECSRLFKVKSMLRRHMLRHTKDMKFPCRICDKTFTSQASLSNHKYVHSKKRRYKCSECHKWKFFDHKQQHFAKRKHSCKQCTKQIFKKCDLSLQLLTQKKGGKRKNVHSAMAVPSTTEPIHNSDNEVECDICKKLFPSKTALASHAQYHGEHYYTCDSCGKSYNNKERIIRHLAICQGNKESPCPVCNNKPTKNQTCCMRKSICAKCFKPISINVHDIGKPCSYLCKKCKGENFNFNNKDDLDTRLTKFVCNICGIIFAKMEELSNHKMSHTVNKLSKCPICNKKLTYLSNSQEPVQCCIRKSVCIKCMESMNIVYKAGKISTYLCKSCTKDNEEKRYVNLSHSRALREILKSHGKLSQKSEFLHDKILENKESNTIQKCTDGDTKLSINRVVKEELDMGEYFLDYQSTESQPMLAVGDIKTECD